MSKGSTPAAPDYTQAAITQGNETQQLNAQQTAANRPNVNTPFGNLDYTTSLGYDPATNSSVTNYNENVSLTPAEQQALTSQQAIQAGESQTAQNLLPTVASDINHPVTTAPSQSLLTGAGQGINQNPQLLDQNTTNAVFDQFKQLNQPLQNQQTESTQAQLAAQGLKPGDAAYNNAVNNLSNTQYAQNQSAEDQALLAGEQEGSTLFGEQNAAQAQAFGQGATQTGYNNSTIGSGIANQQAELGLNEQQAGYGLNLLNGLETGQQVSLPSFPGTTSAGSGQAANLLNAAELTGNSNLNAYNAQVGGSNAALGAAGSIAGGLLAAFA